MAGLCPLAVLFFLCLSHVLVAVAKVASGGIARESGDARRVRAEQCQRCRFALFQKRRGSVAWRKAGLRRARSLRRTTQQAHAAQFDARAPALAFLGPFFFFFSFSATWLAFRLKAGGVFGADLLFPAAGPTECGYAYVQAHPGRRRRGRQDDLRQAPLDGRV
jgi:hypothetical protein